MNMRGVRVKFPVGMVVVRVEGWLLGGGVVEEREDI